MVKIHVSSPEIAHASLHKSVPWPYHIYALPFTPLYPLLAYAYYIKYDTWLKSEEWTFLACVAVFGGHALSFLGTRWSVGFRAMVTTRGVRSEEGADCVRVVPPKHRGKAEIVKLMKDGEGVRFMYNHATFIQDTSPSSTLTFSPLPYPTASHPPLSSLVSPQGLKTPDVTHLTSLFGTNTFPIPIPTFLALFAEHATAPFFVFQIFCVALWCLDEYWYYSLFTLFMLVMFECTVCFQRLKTLQEFRTMSVEPYVIQCKRDGKWAGVNTAELVPGDVVSITRVKGQEETTIPADVLLLEGSAILNEAMLSGESTPLLKESVELLPRDVKLEADEGHKLHVLFGGTKLLQASSATSPSSSSTDDTESSLVLVNQPPKTPDGGSLALVLRTGFGTAQGSLVRTMIFATERISANNASSLVLILFLLLFALASASYVWVVGLHSRKLPKSKLLLDCILIVTSVVPPELPMELSMAVNASLVALGKYAVFVTEPFRIPDAGRVDVVCWDKTGTVTRNEMVCEGVVGVGDVKDKDPKALIDLATLATTNATVTTIAAAHALVRITDDEGKTTIVGDPMEKASLDSLGWVLEQNGVVRALSKAEKEEMREQEEKRRKIVVVPRLNGNATPTPAPAPAQKGGPTLAIQRRFAFSSALKRMSSISITKDRRTIIAVKGAPETIRGMLRVGGIPSWYDECYKYHMRRGGRVIALGGREERWGVDKIMNVPREEVEANLDFRGFLVFSCPLKEDAVSTLKMIGDASHRCIMITGDNPLTAVHVARDVEIVDRDVMVMDVPEGTGDLIWHTIDESKIIPVDPSEPLDRDILREYDICITGAALKHFTDSDSNPNANLKALITHTYVYARVSPSQKEFILTALKGLGYITLMAGDGTNDVGALKQAHVGVALLDGTMEDLQRIAERARVERVKKVYEAQLKVTNRFKQAPPPVPPLLKGLYPELESARQVALENKEKNPMEKFDIASITDRMADMEGEGEPPKIKLGDASCAAPFTSKLSNVSAIANIIRQGRCTLVATIQMYKILALNCLITAYSLSVLYLDGIKFGDYQVTITGMVMSVCFFCISRAKPVEKLSRERPLTDIFNLYILLSILIQFAIHIASLVYITALSDQYQTRGPIDVDAKFEPSLLNTAIYLLGLSQQVSTFAINFQGRPFREGIRENASLYWGLVGAEAVAFCGATDFMPELNRWLQIVEMESSFMFRLTVTMILDYAGCWLTEIVCKKLFADLEPKEFVTRGRERREIRRKEEERLKAIEAEKEVDVTVEKKKQ